MAVPQRCAGSGPSVSQPGGRLATLVLAVLSLVFIQRRVFNPLDREFFLVGRSNVEANLSKGCGHLITLVPWDGANSPCGQTARVTSKSNVVAREKVPIADHWRDNRCCRLSEGSLLKRSREFGVGDGET